MSPGPSVSPSTKPPHDKAGPPAPIDARGPRFNQGMVALLVLAAFVFEARWVYAVVGLVLLLSAAGGSDLGPFLRIYRDLIKPRLSPPSEVEDPRPPRFAAAIGATLLAVVTIAWLSEMEGLADLLALVVAALAALAAITGVCVGCELYVAWSKWRDRGRTSGSESAPSAPSGQA